MKPRPVDPDNNEAPPTCAADCGYMREFSSFDLQRNALRIETAHMIGRYRCGWNLKPGHIGGRALDYAPCIWPRNRA